jgi:hypothetical protein
MMFSLFLICKIILLCTYAALMMFSLLLIFNLGSGTPPHKFGPEQGATMGHSLRHIFGAKMCLDNIHCLAYTCVKLSL